MDNMTTLTKEMFERATQIDNIADAVNTLLRFEHFRTLGDVLRAFSPNPDVKRSLVDGLQEWFPNDRRDAIDRKVRNWLNGKTQALSKHDAYVLCRVWNLPLEKADAFLKLAVGEGIHWRNPEDIVWCYGIVHCMNPSQLYSLLERSQTRLPAAASQAYGMPETYTYEIHEKLAPVLYQTEEELLDFLSEYQARLGVFHNTAYQLFRQYMNVLRKGYSENGMEALFQEITQKEKRQAQILVDGDIGPHKPEQISTRDILEVYLYRKLIPINQRGNRKKADAFSAIQRSIRQNWPDEFSLSRMESRKQDISRKVLMLLFLATDGTDSTFADTDDFEEGETSDELFMSIYIRMNLMLNDCGFQQLDPRNPFDWMILFCIASGDLWEVDNRLHDVLITMFP